VRVGFWTLIAALVLLATDPASGQGEGVVAVQVAPRFCQEPCSIALFVDVEQHQADRELIIEADSGGFYRSSLIQLDGIDEPPVHSLIWTSLPAGLYEIRITLKRATGHVEQIATDVRVVGS
jgi:hypothetical protein